MLKSRRKNEMKHIGLVDRVEWARGILSAERKAAIRSHIDDGCETCARALALWERVVTMANREVRYRPPQTAVDAAKSFFTLYGPKKTAPLKEKIARLIYDSFHEPLPAGIRSAMRSSRQALYKTGSFVLDLRLEALPGTNRLSLVGQVLHQADPLKGVTDLPVVLVTEKSKVAETTTNAFGEFQLEFDADKKNRLSIVLDEKRAIVIPSDGLQMRSSKGKARSPLEESHQNKKRGH